jgi:hypothetical protein
MTVFPERYGCDVCGEPIGADECVALATTVGRLVEDLHKGGWIAHFHPDCYWEVQADVWAAARRTEFDDRWQADELERIPVATERDIARARSRHAKSPPAEGRRPVLVGDDDSLLRVLEEAKIPTRYNVPIGSLTQAARMTDGELRALRGIGPKAIRAIREAARARGLTTDLVDRMEATDGAA